MDADKALRTYFDNSHRGWAESAGFGLIESPRYDDRPWIPLDRQEVSAEAMANAFAKSSLRRVERVLRYYEIAPTRAV